MRVFLTSATGHVGSAVARAFQTAGHSVAALARSHERADALRALGIQPHLGDLRAPEAVAEAAAPHDVVIHTAFGYDADGREMQSTDVAVVEALLNDASSSTVRQLVYTSSAFLLGGLGGDAIDEHAPTERAQSGGAWRLALERRVLESGGPRLRTAVIRLGVVYGARNFTMHELFTAARQHGHVPFHGTGADRWPLVYREDLASLYVAIAERQATGVFHGVDGHPLTVARVAELASIAAGCEGRTRSLSADGAGDVEEEHAARVSRDVPVVTVRSLELGWRPRITSFEEGAPVAYREWLECVPPSS